MRKRKWKSSQMFEFLDLFCLFFDFFAFAFARREWFKIITASNCLCLCIQLCDDANDTALIENNGTGP